MKRIAVFRALVLGDLLCAVPALRALRRRWPDAELTLVGLPWAREWARRSPELDHFIEFPGYPGLPERGVDVAAWPGFLQAVQQPAFDLAVQLHGSGGVVNAIVSLFGARRTAGFMDDRAAPLDDACPWPVHGTEAERLLALTDRLGCPRDGEHLTFPWGPEDDAALDAQAPDLAGCERLVCVHPGAQLPSRRWPVERFAAVADRLADAGHTIVLTGTEGERPLVAAVRAAMRRPSRDLCGATTLWTLGALVRRARLVVCNDTGISHVAAALGTPTVVVSLGADVARWAPRDRQRHRVLWADVPCRPCAFRECPVGHPCADAVSADDAVRAAQEQMTAVA